MAIRDAVKPAEGAKAFAEGFYEYVYGKDGLEKRFEAFAGVISELPRKQTRVHTWPLQTIFGFLGNPDEHIFLKPRVTQVAAEKYAYDFNIPLTAQLGYVPEPDWFCGTGARRPGQPEAAGLY